MARNCLEIVAGSHTGLGRATPCDCSPLHAFLYHAILIEWLYGLVNLYFQVGICSSPDLTGASDTNPFAGITQSWFGSLDGLNIYDDFYRLSFSGELSWLPHPRMQSVRSIG